MAYKKLKVTKALSAEALGSGGMHVRSHGRSLRPPGALRSSLSFWSKSGEGSWVRKRLESVELRD